MIRSFFIFSYLNIFYYIDFCWWNIDWCHLYIYIYIHIGWERQKDRERQTETETEGQRDRERKRESATDISSCGANSIFYQAHYGSVPSPSYLLSLTWISNYIHYKMWDEISYSFPKFNDITVKVCEWTTIFIPHFLMNVITFPC